MKKKPRRCSPRHRAALGERPGLVGQEEEAAAVLAAYAADWGGTALSELRGNLGRAGRSTSAGLR